MHVLVHRESEEYNTSDVEDNSPVGKDLHRRPPEIKISPGSDDLYPCEAESIVKIMVESPKDPPQVDYHFQSAEKDEEVEDIKVDVNVPVDATNLYYEYEDPKVDKKQS